MLLHALIELQTGFLIGNMQILFHAKACESKGKNEIFIELDYLFSFFVKFPNQSKKIVILAISISIKNITNRDKHKDLTEIVNISLCTAFISLLLPQNH